MGRRSKLDYGEKTIERVIQLWKQGYTYAQIAEILKSEGIETSRSAVARKIKNWKEVAEKYRQAREQVKALVEAIKEQPNTELAEVANELLLQKILEEIVEIEEIEGSPYQLVQMLAKLSRAQTDIARVKMQYMERAKKAAEKIEETLKEKNIDPETLALIKEQVYGIVE